MRRVVVNSTPIIALCNADALFVLHELYGEIIVPRAVYDEVTVKTDSACNQIKNQDWINVYDVVNLQDKKMYRAKLHDGEVEVMLTAQEITDVDLVVIDDAAAKSTAKYLGLNVTGTLGVLIRAKQEHIISSVRDVLVKIRKNGFYISDDVVNMVLGCVDE